MICCICGKVSPETHVYCLYCGTDRASVQTVEGQDRHPMLHAMIRRCDTVMNPEDAWLTLVHPALTSLEAAMATEVLL